MRIAIIETLYWVNSKVN